MSATSNITMPTSNATAPVDQPSIHEGQNVPAVSMFIGIGMVVFFTAILLGIGAYFWIQKLIKKWRARKANGTEDIELQRRSNPQDEGPAPPSPDAPGLFYLNQDHATGIEAPPPTYSASSVGDYFNKR